MNWKKWTIAGAICVFFVGNTYLIVRSDSKVKRANAVDKWTVVKQEDLVSTKKGKGVITPAEEKHVYFDEKVGSFGKFLVAEGDTVQAGTPLFEYSSANGEARKTQLEAEVTKLEKEITGIEDHISELEDLLADLPEQSKKDKESNQALRLSLEQDIQAREEQKTRLQAEVDKYNDLIAAEDDSLTNLTVTSEIAGVVKEISSSLKNPVITIASNEQQIEGVLSEKELRLIAKDMKVYAYTESAKQRLEGTISSIAALPKENPDVKTESEYPFVVKLNGEAEGLAYGSHVQLNIITKEEPGSLTVPARVLQYKNEEKAYLYVLRANGSVDKRKVKTGIHFSDRQGLASGVKKGDIVADAPEKLVVNSEYFTPLKVSRLHKKTAVDGMRKKEILRYMCKGFLARQ
ncbi:efflux RND transporter periplasmic adaptor subunit [Cytobacillus sp. Hz8]|uniref:efflux RND transporter periplasmic adaptor subunit n=1 Tax=Cytobacillus sp. Hz8 TaxID=3347168 RepID=UPI0035DCCEB5